MYAPHASPPPIQGGLGSLLGHRLKDSLDRVSQSELCLLLTLWALRSLVWPYWGIAHDAQIYSLQVMNRATGGIFAEDLFLSYGSQDS